MSTERARTVLHQRLDEAVGSEAADTLMSHLPPTGWADVATKNDLHHQSSLLRAELHAETAALRTEMHDGFADIRTEMRHGFAEHDTRFVELEGMMAAGFATQRAEFERGLRRFTTTSVAALGTSVAVALGLTQLLD